MIVLIHWQGQIALEIKWINYLSKTHKKIPDFLGRNLGRNRKAALGDAYCLAMG
jgi:hypothetical protein